MMHVDRYLLVRAASLYLTALAALAVWIWRRPSRRAVAGAALACCWSIPAILALNVLAVRAGWWRFDASGGLLLGMPVDLCLAWIALWGLIPALAFPAVPMAVVVLVALAIELGVNPSALLLPRSCTADEPVDLTPAVLVPAWAAWAWADGRLPLPADPDGSTTKERFAREVDFSRNARPVFADRTPADTALFEIYELAAETLPLNDRHLVTVYKELASLCEEVGRTGDGMRYLKLALEVQETRTLRAHVTSG